MHSPSTTDSSAALGTYRDLLSDNRRRIRGLSSRWKILNQTHSIGAEALSVKCKELETAHRISFETLLRDQEQDLGSAITRWDWSLDKLLGDLERHTLESLQLQKEHLAKAKSNFKAARSAELTAYDQSKQKLSKRTAAAKEQAKKLRDTELAKIDREKQSLDQRMQAALEWIGTKTGQPALVQWTSQTPPVRSDEIANLATIDLVSKQFERTKGEVIQRIDEMQNHPSLRIISFPMLILLGILSGACGGGIAFALTRQALIWGGVGIAAAIIVPSLVSLAASPLLSKKFKQLFVPIVDTEKELHAILMRGRKLLEQNYASTLSKLESEFKTELQSLEESHQRKLETIDSEYQENKKSIAETAVRKRVEFAARRKQEMVNIDQSESKKISESRNKQVEEREQVKKLHAKTLHGMHKEFDAFLGQSAERWRSGVHRVSKRISQQEQAIEVAYPTWSSQEMLNGTWKRDPDAVAWPIGHIGVERLFRSTSGAEELSTHGLVERRIPVLFDLLHHGSLVLDHDLGGRAMAQGSVRQLLLRAITSLPAGSMQVTVIDPEGLGKEFSWLMHLADIDPQLVNHRVWTQPVHIAHQLELNARHVEDVIQQSLRNRYRNLAEYNLHAGPMAIPYRFIVWSGFPFGLDEHSWQALCSLLASGARCGVGVILSLAENCKWPPFADPARLRQHGIVIELRGEQAQATLLNSGFDDSSLDLVDSPSDEQVHAIMEHQLVAARSIGKRIVPFSTIVPAESQRFVTPTADGLEIPIGVSESGRPQLLSLGSGTAQHVLIAGKTGSGKSSLLHTMITSGSLRYSPDELRMVLLDFKKGVEFQVYAQEQLPHADIIGIESRREFGLSTLEYLDRVLTARGEAFREWGVQDLPSLKRKHPDIVLPRILIVIDEFQELFVEDDKLSQQASLLVDRLVRQGRSFGMHLVLASQTLGGSYSLPRTTLAQMAVRIALQCDNADAMLILSEDNSAAERLRHSGQGIYNDAGGRIEGNHNFQVSYLEKTEQTRWLNSLPVHRWTANPIINPIGKPIVFEGHKPSRWQAKNVQAVLQAAPQSIRSQAPWVLGESVSIEPPVLRAFPPVAGRNVMIVGNESSLVAGLLVSWVRSTQAMERQEDSAPRFLILDGSSADDEPMSRAVQWLKKQPERVRIGTVRDLSEILSQLQSEWSNRNSAPDRNYPPLILFIANLSRFREFRRSDDFSFSSQEGDMSPDAMLTRILADGPGLGIHVCIWSDTATTLSRWLPRNALRDIEIRVLMQMSASDSNQLIDSSAANRLDRYVLLVHDDADGKAVKFRPYELGSILQDADQ
jgi:S-DNA-T family DNA segregation ATPase FtsK/SpoIIIE